MKNRYFFSIIIPVFVFLFIVSFKGSQLDKTVTGVQIGVVIYFYLIGLKADAAILVGVINALRTLID